MAYLVKPDHGIALVNLVAYDPQPRCLGLQFTRVTPTGSSLVTEGAYFVLEWDIFGSNSEDVTEYQAALTLTGLTSLLTREVTVMGPDINYNLVRYNATALKPIPGQSISRNNFFIRNGGIMFIDLTAL